MPRLAFQEEVEALAAATQSLSPVAPRSAEVLDLKRASIIRSTAGMIEGYRKMASYYILATHELPRKFEAVKAEGPTTKISGVVDALRRSMVGLSRPALVDRDGDNVVEMLDFVAEQWAKRSSDEGRYVRRQSKKVREAGEACDVHRLKVLVIVTRMLAETEELERLWCAPQAARNDRNAFDDVFEAVISDHPVIMAHLAR